MRQYELEPKGQGEMDVCKVIQVIQTCIERRGDGREVPCRLLTQYWTIDGKLLFEVDPLAEITTPETLKNKKFKEKNDVS